MDNQEIFNQIRELQKQRTLLSAQDTALVNKINELRDKIVLKNIKKGYYTDNNGLYCKVYDIKEDVIFVYEVSEEPKKGRVFLYKTIFKGYGLNKIIDGNEWKYIIKYKKATQWLYIDDLLPKKGD